MAKLLLKNIVRFVCIFAILMAGSYGFSVLDKSMGLKLVDIFWITGVTLVLINLRETMKVKNKK